VSAKKRKIQFLFLLAQETMPFFEISLLEKKNILIDWLSKKQAVFRVILSKKIVSRGLKLYNQLRVLQQGKFDLPSNNEPKHKD